MRETEKLFEKLSLRTPPNPELAKRREEALEEYIRREIPKGVMVSTSKQYGGAWKRWMEYVMATDGDWGEYVDLTVSRFVAFRRKAGGVYTGRPCTATTIKQNLTGIRHVLVTMGKTGVVGYSKETMPRTYKLLKAIEKGEGEKGKRAIPEASMRQLTGLIDKERHDGRVILFYLAISAATIRRSAEVLGGMRAGDILWQNGSCWPDIEKGRVDRWASYEFRKSKTNRNGRIQTAFMWCQCPMICALCSLRDLELRHAMHLRKSSKLLVFEDGVELDYRMALGIVQELCQKVGLRKERYGTHSLRKTGYRNARKQGQSDSLINGQAGWASNKSRVPYEGELRTRRKVDGHKIRCIEALGVDLHEGNGRRKRRRLS